jgi:hypothetical protein
MLFFCYFLIFYLISDYSFAKDVLYNFGGQLDFTMGHIAEQKSGDMRSSGYGWFTTFHPLHKTEYLKGTFGTSLEKSASGKFIINDVHFGYYRQKDNFIIGRSVNAAGYLHQDIMDFGAPGGGIDNTPISYFFAGNFTTNVAQKLTQPFAHHIAYYVQPVKKYFNFGFSYAPSINTFHQENYQFFAQAIVKNEISLGAKNNFSWNNLNVQTTFGYTQAERQFNRFKPMGIISAIQYTMQVQQKSNKINYYRLYELNNGCLKDKQTQDCRTAFQYSNIQNNYIRNIGVQYRYNHDIFFPEIYTDYFIGWSWHFKPSVTVGLETILRVKETQKTINNDFNWLVGLRYIF